MRISSRVAIIVLALALLAPPTHATVSGPALLSQDHSRVDIGSTYGSGKFGSWIVDRFGLPAYRYTLDQTRSKYAPNAEMGGRTDAWHQVGNDHIVANSYNHGYTQLWSQDRMYQWMNYPAPTQQHYAGGFGYLRSKQGTLSTLWQDRPKGAATAREFGVGYGRHAVGVPGRNVEEFVYAPFGNDPVLLHDVTIRNTGSSTLDASWFEYWDVNPMLQLEGRHQRGVLTPSYDKATRTLSVDQVPLPTDTDPLSIFATSLNAPVAGWDTDVSSFFGGGSRAKPAAVVANKTSQSVALPSTPVTPSTTMFAFKTPVRVPAGGSVTLRYAYGAAHQAQIKGIVSRGRASSLRASESRWSSWLPQVAFGNAGPWLSRELQWDAYMVRSGATYEEKCGHHILSQGGYYQYDNGFQGAYRDPLQHMLPMIYSDPALARDVLMYSAHEQPALTGITPYALLSNCTRFDLGTSDDLDFWLLWASAEYALATRDFSFFNRREPYADRGDGTLWEHLKLAFFHQEHVIGRGPHGGYITGATGDWSDFETEFMQMTESMLVTAQLAYGYQVIARVADVRKDRAFAADLRAAAARNVATLKKEWTGKGWYSRGYSFTKQFGNGAINSEPQPWAVMAGAASAGQSRRLVANIKRYLTGHGAPGGPSKIGSAQSPAANDPGVTEHMTPQIFASADYVGNVWYALNGALVWSLEAIDPTFAWDEFKRNTLAAHANAFPTHWDGTISVDDECHAWYAMPAAQCGTGLSSAYYGQILHQPAWSLWDAIKLAGIAPTTTGYRISPHVPSEDFVLKMPGVGVERSDRSMRGYVRPEASGKMTMEVTVPSKAVYAVYVNGKGVNAVQQGSTVKFTLPLTRGKATDWSLEW